VNQKNQKNIVATSNIANRLAQNNVNAQNEAPKFQIANSIQTTASGGIKEAAIATQAILSQSLLNFKLKTATIAENTAIKKSIIFGLLRDVISAVSISNHTKITAVNHINIEIQIEIIKTLKAVIKNFCHHLAIE
jgi:hypothetical protein